MFGLHQNRLVLPAIAVSLCGSLWGSAHAQVTATYTSLEALVAQAESVVRGSIIKVSRQIKVPKHGRLPNGTLWPSGLVQYTLTVKVDEVLKGKKTEELQLVRETSAYDQRCTQWCDARTELLWFLGQRDTYANTTDNDADRKWGLLRLGKPVPDERSYKEHAPPIFSMDFRVLKQRDEILAAARRAAVILERSSHKPIKCITVDIPHGVAAKCRPCGDANFFTVPVIQELEPIARKMITAPEKLDRYYPGLLRLSGVEILANFKSDENTALLKNLLDDPTSVISAQNRRGKPREQPVRKYVVRATAHMILKRWKVKLPKPIVQETLRSDDRKTTVNGPR